MKLSISPSVLFVADPPGCLDGEMQLHFFHFFFLLLRVRIQSGTDQTQGFKKNGTTIISPYNYRGVSLLFFLPTSLLLPKNHHIRNGKKEGYATWYTS